MKQMERRAAPAGWLVAVVGKRISKRSLAERKRGWSGVLLAAADARMAALVFGWLMEA
jgi:hypothetical protein